MLGLKSSNGSSNSGPILINPFALPNWGFAAGGEALFLVASISANRSKASCACSGSVCAFSKILWAVLTRNR